MLYSGATGAIENLFPAPQGGKTTNTSVLTVPCDLLTESFKAESGFFIEGTYAYDSAYAKMSDNRKTLVWYNTRTAKNQLNVSGKKYVFALFCSGGGDT